MAWLRNDTIAERTAVLKSHNYTYRAIAEKLVTEFQLPRTPSDASLNRWIKRGNELIEKSSQNQSVLSQSAVIPNAS